MRPWQMILSTVGLLMLLATSFVAAAGNGNKPDSAANPATRPSTPIDPSLLPVTDDPKLPRVLILGDSISMGYTVPVRKLLVGKANVHRAAANCEDTARGLKKLDEWLTTDSPDGQKWDVIVFNFGLHDLKYLDEHGTYVNPPNGRQVASPETYEKNLRELVSRLKKTGARMIFASTTPVPDGTQGRVAGDELAYNKVAEKVMSDNGVQFNDLHAVVEKDPQSYQLPHNVHFTAKGYEALAKSLADSIETALKGER